MNILDTQQKSEKSQMQILTDISLWKMLAQGTKKTRKRSRFEAFFDLLNRQRIALLAEDEGSINFSALELSKAWGWDRVTVTRFIDNLQKRNVLTVSTSRKRKLVRIEGVTLVKEPPGTSPFHSDTQTAPQADNST